MNGVLGMTELVLESEVTPEQRECLTMARTSAQSLVTLINEILDFSKIEAGKMQTDSVAFPIYEVITETVRPLALQAAEKGLEFVYDVSPALPERLIGDGGRLGQIITNLIGNAVKFTREGSVAVHVAIDEQTDADVVLHVRVADTGIGIPREKQQAIFDAFTQADGSITRQFGGTGLGLSIASRLVTLMGGRMWLESEPGQGATFHFTLPQRVAPPPRPAPQPPAASAGRSGRAGACSSSRIIAPTAPRTKRRSGTGACRRRPSAAPSRRCRRSASPATAARRRPWPSSITTCRAWTASSSPSAPAATASRRACASS